MIETDIFTEGEIDLPHNIDGDFFSRIANSVFSKTGTDKVHVTIILTDNEEITKINADFRNKNEPTDVISFAYRDEPFPGAEGLTEELGDVYISIEKARYQADEAGITVQDELKRLTIHGLLHLIGYDHEKSQDEEDRMNRLEEELFLIC